MKYFTNPDTEEYVFDNIRYKVPYSGERMRSFWNFFHNDSTYLFKDTLLNYIHFKPYIVVDIGACIGSLSLYAASVGADVIAIEASPENTNLLNINRNNNIFTNVIVINRAVSKESDMDVELFKAGGNIGQFSLIYNRDVSNYKVNIKTIGFNDLFSRIDGIVDFMKIDIEGGEYSIIDKYSSDNIRRCRFIDIDSHPITKDFYILNKCEYGNPDTAHIEILDFLGSIGFKRVYEDNKRLWYNTEIIKNLEWRNIVKYTYKDSAPYVDDNGNFIYDGKNK